MHAGPDQPNQNFSTHHRDDGVPEPLSLNLHIFLEDITDFDGPLFFLPGSHKLGCVAARHNPVSVSYALRVVEEEVVRNRAATCSMVSTTKKAGTGLIFADCLVYGAPPDSLPSNRNSLSTIVTPTGNTRARVVRNEYQHHRDLTQIRLLQTTICSRPWREVGAPDAARGLSLKTTET